MSENVFLFFLLEEKNEVLASLAIPAPQIEIWKDTRYALISKRSKASEIENSKSNGRLIFYDISD